MSGMIKDFEKVKNAQRVLHDKVSNLVKVNGVVDEATKGAIQNFEFKNGLPMTGELSYRVYRMLVDEAKDEPEETEELLDEIEDDVVIEDDDADWEESEDDA